MWTIEPEDSEFNRNSVMTDKAPLPIAIEMSKKFPLKKIIISTNRHRAHLKNGKVVWEQADLNEYFDMDKTDKSDLVDLVIFAEMLPSEEWQDYADAFIPAKWAAIDNAVLIKRYQKAVAASIA